VQRRPRRAATHTQLQSRPRLRSHEPRSMFAHATIPSICLTGSARKSGIRISNLKFSNLKSDP